MTARAHLRAQIVRFLRLFFATLAGVDLPAAISGHLTSVNAVLSIIAGLLVGAVETAVRQMFKVAPLPASLFPISTGTFPTTAPASKVTVTSPPLAPPGPAPTAGPS